MAEGRAPYECVCGFTAGTSFAWEKHLALRNTPYSTVRHSLANGSARGTPVDLHGRDFSGSEMSSSSARSSADTAVPYPTPKALFREGSQGKSPEPMMQYRQPATPQYTTPQAPMTSSLTQGLRLEEAARRGDMDRVARLAVEVLRLAQQGDSQAVLDMVAPMHQAQAGGHGGVDRLGNMMGKMSVKESKDYKFSSHISAVHQERNGISIEQVPTGLRDGFTPEPQGRKDALRLLAMTEPLMDNARNNQMGPMPFGVDTNVLKRTIIAVAQHATRITARESRVLDINAPCYVLGDIHGNLVDLQFFRKTLWPAGPEVTAGDFLFLGDFVDRGKDSIPVIAYIMAMKILNPNKWWMIRGNHETREVNGNIDHYQQGSFLSQCIQAFGDRDGRIVWEAVNTFFDTLPLAASIDNSIFCVHGGIPRELCSVEATLDMIRRVEVPLRTAQNNQMVYDMLWSDPSTPEQEGGADLDRGGFGMSPRGCSCFGERSLDIFLNKYSFQHVFRGHEAQQSGVGVSKSARLTTIFSTSRDHFAQDITATCGCVLVDHEYIHPIVRALPQTHVGLKPTYAEQSVEASEVHVLHDGTTTTHHEHRAPHSHEGYGNQWGDNRNSFGRDEVVQPPPRRSAWENVAPGIGISAISRQPQQWLSAGR
mmetsp:Transcript_53897/g.131759  ORF Transcript_53897/g.131759 Transcript_53897/m.131759 type:complete len:651 (+) Transcript_53897:121-2073(+)